MEDSPYLTCCVLIIAFPLAMLLYAAQSVNSTTAVEQWATNKGYKIVNQKEYMGLRHPLKYPRYARIFLVDVEDSDGLTRRAKVVVSGKSIFEAKWDD